jgi:predicted metal-dependent phosphoesterase TrpH
MNCDMHTHTVHSDGSLTPTELVAEAREKNLIIALTDHNTVSGLPEFMAEALRQDVTAVGGTELSCVYGGKEFHLIGLFIEPENYSSVENLCIEYHSLKEKSNIDLIDKLCAMGYELNYSEIQKENVNGRINRAHIASALVKGGYVSSVPEAFESLLDEKCGIYTPPKRLSLADGIRFLRSIKAVPVLAHPLKEIDGDSLRKMLPEMIEAGLIGIETMHSSYDEEKIALSKEIAREYGLLESGGSDFHGRFKPGISLGVGRGNLAINGQIYYNLLEAKSRL